MSDSPVAQETFVITLPLVTRTRPLERAKPAKTIDIENTTATYSSFSEVMPMVYPAVSGAQTSKYGSLHLYGNTKEYFITISVGSPAQIFTLQLDTGSAITALPSGGCTDCYHYNTPYNSSISSTSSVFSCTDPRCTSGTCNPDNTCNFRVGYGDGSYIQGNLVSDVMGLPSAYTVNNGLEGSGPTVNTVTSTLFPNTPIVFGAITDQSSGFQFLAVDGIMGLAFGGSSLSCVPNCASLVFDQIVQKYNIPDIFAIALKPISNTTTYNQVGGSISFGGIDAAFLGPNTVYWTDVTAKPYYQVLLGDITIGGHSIGASIDDFGSTIVDSGTTFTIVPPKIFSAIQSVMQQNYCHLPFVCGPSNMFTNMSCVNSSLIDLSKFPDFTFFLDGVKVVMKPDQYLLETQLSNGDMVNCLSVIAGSRSKTFLGDSFMMGAYIIFDRQSTRVGFANDAQVSSGPRISNPEPNKIALIAGAAGGGAALIIIIIAAVTTVLLRRRTLKRREDRAQDIGVKVQTPAMSQRSTSEDAGQS